MRKSSVEGAGDEVKEISSGGKGREMVEGEAGL